MEIEIVGNGLTPFGGGITPFGSGITPFGSGLSTFGGSRSRLPLAQGEAKRGPPRKLPKMLGGNFSNDPRSPTALNKSQLAQLKELPKKSPVPVFDRHSLNLLNNVVQSKQIIEGGGMRVYK